MKINKAVLTPFVGYMKSTGHNVRSRNGRLTLSKGKNNAAIDCMNDDLLVNSYGHRLYMEFMYKWLNQGKQFIRSMRNLGAMIITRLQGKNFGVLEMKIEIILLGLLGVFLLFCYALYKRKKHYTDYVKRKEDDHRKFNDDRNKAYWRK